MQKKNKFTNFVYLLICIQHLTTLCKHPSSTGPHVFKATRKYTHPVYTENIIENAKKTNGYIIFLWIYLLDWLSIFTIICRSNNDSFVDHNHQDNQINLKKEINSLDKLGKNERANSSMYICRKWKTPKSNQICIS